MADGIDFTLSVTPPRALGAPAATVVGEGLRVVASLHNATEQQVFVPRGATTPVVYELIRVVPTEPPLAFRRSPAERLGIALADSQMPPFDEVPDPVEPGALYEMSDDLVACHPSGIPVGEYSVVAHCPVGGIEFDSNAVRITVQSASIGQFVELFCPFSFSQAQAFDHCDDQGRLWLLLRDTKDERAEAGSFSRLFEIPGDGALAGLAVATHLAPRLSGRWVAWLRAGFIGASQASGGRLVRSTAMLAMTLDRAMLLPTGFEHAPAAAPETRRRWTLGDARFVVVGEVDGVAHVQHFSATGAGIAAGAIAPLRSGPRPERVLVRFSVAQGRLDLIWADTDGDFTRIVARGYTIEGQPLSEQPQVLFECRAPLLALEVFALDKPDGNAQPTRAHALFGATGASLAYVRIPLDAALHAEEHEIKLPAAPEALAFDRYAIAPLVAGGHLVLASRGAEIWRASVADPRWTLLHAAPAPVSQLHAAVSNNRYWAALAVAGAHGVICAPDPDYSDEAG